MHRALPTLAVAAALLGGGATADARPHFKHCGDAPSILRHHIQARGVSCATARRTGRLVSQHVRVVRTRLFEYHTGAWTCRYTVFSSTKAGDGEGEIFDCRRPGREVRWSNAPGILPRTLF